MRDSTPAADRPPEPGETPAAPASGARGLGTRIAGLSGWRRLLAAALAGAAMTMGHAPVDLPWVWFLAMPALVLLVAGARGGWGAAAAGWAAGFGYFVSGLHWIGHAFLVDAETYAWMMPFAVTLLPAGLGIFWALAAAAARRLAGPDPLRAAAALAATLTLAEYARSHVFTGFPWALPGYVWIETPVAQAAAWAGPHGLTLLTLLLTALPGLALARRSLPTGLAAGTALAAGAALWLAGTARLADSPSDAGRPVLRVVQPNAEQHLKWRAEHAPVFYRRLLDASAAPPDPALGPPAAVIWPETAISFLPAEYPEERLRMARAAGGAPLLLGALYREPAAGGARWTNSLFDLGPGGEIRARYDKHHLVPFGEYLPGGNLLRSLGIRALAERGAFIPGPGPRLMEVPGLPPFLPLICYEAIFPHEVTAPEGRAGWLLQITNDAWFGRFAGPHQHLDQARMRAIEQGLPVVRSANTGISAVIDPMGRITASLGLGLHGHIDARLPEPLPPTRYARIGDWPALLGAFLLLLLVKLGQTVTRRA